uniref:Secreted protein n=1 Tax=Triticum urartu TaxID=4572 RepID=A0A8R7K2Q9_TRIUA
MSSDLGLRVLMLCLLRAHAMACSGCHPPAPTLIPSPPLTLLLLLVTQVHGRVPAPLSNCCRWTRHEPSWLLPPPTLLNLHLRRWMDGVYGRIEVFPQHFTPEKEPMDGADGLSTSKSNMDPSPSPHRRSWTPKRVKGVYRFCCLFLALGGLPATRMMTRPN